jgi:hypothetical protein
MECDHIASRRRVGGRHVWQPTDGSPVPRCLPSVDTGGLSGKAQAHGAWSCLVCWCVGRSKSSRGVGNPWISRTDSNPHAAWKSLDSPHGFKSPRSPNQRRHARIGRASGVWWDPSPAWDPSCTEGSETFTDPIWLTETPQLLSAHLNPNAADSYLARWRIQPDGTARRMRCRFAPIDLYLGETSLGFNLDLWLQSRCMQLVGWRYRAPHGNATREEVRHQV